MSWFFSKKLVGLETPKPTKCPVGLEDPLSRLASSSTCQYRGSSWTPQWLLLCWGDSMRLEILTEEWFRIFALLTWKLTSRWQGKESPKPVKCYTSFLSHYIDQSNYRAHAVSWGWRNRVLTESRGEKSHCRRECSVGNVFEAIFGKLSSNTRNVNVISLISIV